MRHGYPYHRAPPVALAGPTEGAAPLLVGLGLLGAAGLIGYLLWPKEPDQYEPNYNVRWAGLREFIRQSKAREKEASAVRDRQLAMLSQQCRAKKQQITDQCRIERQRTREVARSVKAQEKARRADAWDTYRWHSERSGAAARKAPKLSRSESDSMAERSVEPSLLPLWREHRKEFDYKLPPDERVERFMEWVHEHEREAQAELADLVTPTDAEFAAAAQQAELEAVPF